MLATSRCVCRPPWYPRQCRLIYRDKSRGALPSCTGAARAVSSAGPSDDGYWSLAEPHKYELEVKKSRFIAFAWPVDTPNEAMGLVKSEGDPSASHNCFAYRIGQNYRSTDDGEPGGTAGRPMLNAIESEGLDHVCVMVTRYFGGTKLGTGGLVRAYGGSARTCLKEAKRIFVKPKVHIEMSMTFDLVGQIYPLLEKVGARRFKEDYGEDGLVTLGATVESGKLEKLTQLVKSASSGSINLKKVPTPKAE